MLAKSLAAISYMTKEISLKALLHWGAFLSFFPHLQLANTLAKYCSTNLSSVYFSPLAKHVIEISCAQALSRNLITEDNISSIPSSEDGWWDTCHIVTPSPVHIQLLHKRIKSEVLWCFCRTSKSFWLKSLHLCSKIPSSYSSFPSHLAPSSHHFSLFNVLADLSHSLQGYKQAIFLTCFSFVTVPATL